MADVKFQLGAEVELFKSDLVGMLDSDSGCLIIRQPNAGFDAPGMTIDEFINDVKKIFEDIKVSVPDITLSKEIKAVTKNISLYLKEIFMLIQTKDPKSLEFAIWVSLETSKQLQDMFPIAIKQGYIKVWNTTNHVILDEMQITNIQALLGKKSEQKALPDDQPPVSE